MNSKDSKYSLSKGNKKFKEYGDYNIYGEDISLQRNDDISPSTIFENILPYLGIYPEY